jgi:hypothetical protein
MIIKLVNLRHTVNYLRHGRKLHKH